MGQGKNEILGIRLLFISLLLGSFRKSQSNSEIGRRQFLILYLLRPALLHGCLSFSMQHSCCFIQQLRRWSYRLVPTPSTHARRIKEFHSLLLLLFLQVFHLFLFFFSGLSGFCLDGSNLYTTMGTDWIHGKNWGSTQLMPTNLS